MAKKTKTTEEVVIVPMPEHLEPKSTSRSLMSNVKVYFYALYNAADKTFQKYLRSIGNKDSITKNRLFDRHEAVKLVKEEAKKSKDLLTLDANDGDIYKCIVRLLKTNGLNPKLRKEEYRRLTRQAATPAE